MSISFRDLLLDERTIEVELKQPGYEGEVVRITYRPSAYTPTHEVKVAELERNRQPISALAESLCGILVSWDVLDDKGKQLEVNRETIYNMPFWFLASISEAISEDLKVSREERKNYDVGSLRKGSKASRQNGTR